MPELCNRGLGLLPCFASFQVFLHTRVTHTHNSLSPLLARGRLMHPGYSVQKPRSLMERDAKSADRVSFGAQMLPKSQGSIVDTGVPGNWKLHTIFASAVSFSSPLSCVCVCVWVFFCMNRSRCSSGGCGIGTVGAGLGWCAAGVSGSIFPWLRSKLSASLIIFWWIFGTSHLPVWTDGVCEKGGENARRVR